MGWRELEALLPNLFIVSVVITLLATRFLGYLKNKHNTLLVMKLLETHPDTDIETIKSIIQPQSPRFIDLRRGVLLTGVSLACVIFAQNMMDPEYRASLLGLSAFPGAIGMIYLMFHFLPKVYLPNQSD